jgi:hypothetical protein
MVLGSTQSLTEMSTKATCGGKCGRWVGLPALPHSCVNCLQILEASAGLYRDCFTFYLQLVTSQGSNVQILMELQTVMQISSAVS